jgi:hypothetical protein
MGSIYENNNSERERERERVLASAVVALPQQRNWLHVLFIIITCYLGLLLIKHKPREHAVGLEPHISVRLERREVMKTNEAATKADLANQLD